MFKNYITIAIRNILKYKFYSILNVIGLATGIAMCLLILLFVQDEISYDKFHENSDRIYRMVADFKLGGNKLNAATVGPPTGQAIKNDYPEVENYVRLMSSGNWFIKYGEKTFKETEVIFADSTLFSVFTIPLLKGNPDKALTQPNSMVISNRMAQKYFTDEDPIGKTLRLDDREDYTVSGVFDNIPGNSHFQSDFILTLAGRRGGEEPYWLGDMSYITYLLLNENVHYKSLEAKFPGMIKKYVGPEIQKFLGKSLNEFEAGGGKTGYYLQPLTDIHLYSNLKDEMQPNGDIMYVIIFLAIAVFILIIACINFMNLSTATSAGRAREVGIKKVLGSERRSLISQFLTESIVISTIATIFALIIVIVVLPYFNTLAGKELEISFLLNYQLLLSVIGITLFIGILAGSYPALFISAFKPVEVLKGKLRLGAKSGLLRSSLVVFQFSASIIMIICTTVVFNQLNYIQNKKLGFDKDQVLIINDTFILQDQIHSFKEDILKNPDVLSGTVSGFLPTESNRGSNGTFKDGIPNEEKITVMQSWRVDYDYVNTMGMELVKGRSFSKDFGSDSMAVIINETAAEFFAWDDPLGNIVGQFSSNETAEVAKYNVIGVVKNFHYESLKNTIGPMLLFLRSSTSNVAFRVNSTNMNQLISFVKNKWNEFAPGQPFDYSFMDEEFNSMYHAEKRIGEVFSVFAFLAIFIGCLGLFGLAAFTAQQRTKEIGVRKVMGATISNVVLLLSKEYIKLILISFVIAAPIAYYSMNSWLEDFAFRTNVGFITLGFAGFTALAIAMLTVSYHAIKIAVTNPVKSLRCE